MLRSMTGFGKYELTQDGRKVLVEIKTVNHRFLDISIRTPRSMMELEEGIRREIKKHLARGRVEIFVSYASDVPGAQEALVNMSLAGAYAKAAREVSETLGINNDVCVSHILELPDVVTYADSEEETELLAGLLEQAVRGACLELIKSRSREGSELEKDITARLAILEDLAATVASREDVVVEEYRDRLRERVSSLTQNMELDEMRMAQEVAIFADRCDVTEEVIRVRSHIEQFRKLMAQEGAQGRNLDFVLQELNREFNTIGSKSQDRTLANSVIDAKGQIEKIKEQIQNIE